MPIKSNALKFILTINATLLLISCAAHHPKTVSQVSQPEQITQSPLANYVQQHHEQDVLSPSEMLQRVQSALQAGNANKAESGLKQLSAPLLSPSENIDYSLAYAKLYLLKYQPRSSIHVLNALSLDKFTQQQTKTYYTLKAETFAQLGEPLPSVHQYAQLLALATDNNEKQNIQTKLFSILQNLSASELKTQLQNESSQQIQSWLALTLILKQAQDNPQTFSNNLAAWSQKYHNDAFTSSLLQSHNLITNAPQKIAILLPLDGPYAGMGQAVKNGLLTAYYAYGHSNLKLQFYDTSHSNITDVYQQAITNKSDFIIGPLTKKNVSSLLSTVTPSVPTLTLNYDQTASTSAQVYQFGLATDDEVSTVIDNARKQNHQRAILIYPNNNWGENIANKFTTAWTGDGDNVTATMSYKDGGNLSSAINSLLKVDQSTQRITDIKHLVSRRILATPYRRHDFDMLFLVASDKYARQIKPLLKFYYASDIPVYTLSMSYPGTPQRSLDRDINGIIFPEIPFIARPTATDKQLLKTIQETWPKSYQQYPRLYALGLDAFSLTAENKLNQLILFPQLAINNSTGALYLSPNHMIHRKLNLIQMQNSRLKAVG